VNGDGRPDLYVANDANPNRLYVNMPEKGGLGFRLEEEAASVGLADPNAGMGIAAGDYSGDGRPDLLVTNSHKQLTASSARTRRAAASPPTRTRAPTSRLPSTPRSPAGATPGSTSTNDGNLDLVIANGAIPVTGTKKSAEPVQRSRT
jgi:hypothetical protein